MPLKRAVMHRLQFANGIRQKEMLRANTLPSITRARVGCFARLGLYEENARFILICLFLILYLLFGAVLFEQLERGTELTERKEYGDRMAFYRQKLCADLGNEDCIVDEIARVVTEAASNGLTNSRPRFDFYGSLFFSSTVISTIGFGSSTPRTKMGRGVTIIYGLFGCTCCVLFFNLYLERFVTAISYFMRYMRGRKLRKRAAASARFNNRNPVTVLVNNEDLESGSGSSSCGEILDTWRPSVYKVFFCLVSISAFLLSVAAWIYSVVEEWEYIDALYFCFISFGTIGFGDYVSNLQDVQAMDSGLYRCLNFFLLTLGACTLYCLFNVSSIVVRQLLNWNIKKMDVKWEGNWLCCVRKKRKYMGLGLRPPRNGGLDCTSSRCSIDTGGCGDAQLSLYEFLRTNNTGFMNLNLGIVEYARRAGETISASRVGPMGILDEKFGEFGEED